LYARRDLVVPSALLRLTSAHFRSEAPRTAETAPIGNRWWICRSTTGSGLLRPEYG